jgi:hypothetical protein
MSVISASANSTLSASGGSAKTSMSTYPKGDTVENKEIFYAHYDEKNFEFLGWYKKSLHKSIPTPNIEVSEEDWQKAINATSQVNYVDVTNKQVMYKDIRTDAKKLSDAKSTQVRQASRSFTQAITADIVFSTKAGVKQTFQADKKSQESLRSAIQEYTLSGTVPKGFFWIAKDNTPVAFTLNDLQELSKAIKKREWKIFKALQKTKTAIRSAQSVEAVVKQKL